MLEGEEIVEALAAIVTVVEAEKKKNSDYDSKDDEGGVMIQMPS